MAEKADKIIRILGIVGIIIVLVFTLYNGIIKKRTNNSNIQSKEEASQIEDEDIQNTSQEEYIGEFDNIGINGRYTNKHSVKPYTECSVYTIQNGKIEFVSNQGFSCEGTYLQEDNKILITYTKKYLVLGGEPQQTYEQEELIVRDNKLIDSTNNEEYIKEIE